MIVGRFGNTSGRPYIHGYVSIPTLNVRGYLRFIVDTGADCSVLMPIDGAVMGIDYSKLTNTSVSLGFGGYSKDFEEPAVMAFTEDNKNLHIFGVDLMISAPSPDIITIPSILGRNILDRWRIRYCPSTGTLEADVISSDSVVSPNVVAGPRAKR